MAVTTLTVLILRHQDEREFDRTIFAYSRERGLMKLRARGTKRGASKLAGSLEPLTEATVTFADGRYGDVVTGAMINERWLSLRHDLFGLTGAQWLAELVERITKLDHHSPDVFDQLRSAWSMLATNQDASLGRRWLDLDRAAYGLLQLEGFVPDIDVCPLCGRTLVGEPVAYRPNVGFIHQSEQRHADVVLDPSVIDVITSGSPAEISREAFRGFHALVDSIVVHVIDRPLKSTAVLRQIVRQLA